MYFWLVSQGGNNNLANDGHCRCHRFPKAPGIHGLALTGPYFAGSSPVPLASPILFWKTKREADLGALFAPFFKPTVAGSCNLIHMSCMRWQLHWTSQISKMMPSNVLRSGEVLLISLIRPQSSVALFVRFAFVQLCRSQLDNLHFLMRFKGQRQCPPFVLEKGTFCSCCMPRARSPTQFLSTSSFCLQFQGCEGIVDWHADNLLGFRHASFKRGKPLFEQEHLERATCLSSLCHIIFRLYPSDFQEAMLYAVLFEANWTSWPAFFQRTLPVSKGLFWFFLEQNAPLVSWSLRGDISWFVFVPSSYWSIWLSLVTLPITLQSMVEIHR